MRGGTSRIELGTAVDMHALAVLKVEPQPVELAARHLHRETRAVLRIFEREKHRSPALLPAQLRHLAFDPNRRQPLDVPRAALLERADRLDLAPLDFCRLDLPGRRLAPCKRHPGRAGPPLSRRRQATP